MADIISCIQDSLNWSDARVKNEIFDVEMLRRRFIRPYFIELGLTVGQGQPHILKELREHGAMNQKELSDACLIEVTTMSRTIDRLEKMGLVKRESNPACRRSWTIALTEEGCEMADKVIEIFEMTDGIMKSGMSEKERNAMGYLISETTKEEREKIVAESLGNIDAACDGCMSGLVEMYQDYIDGKKELREINMEFNARYVKSEDMPGREGRGYQGR